MFLEGRVKKKYLFLASFILELLFFLLATISSSLLVEKVYKQVHFGGLFLFNLFFKDVKVFGGSPDAVLGLLFFIIQVLWIYSIILCISFLLVNIDKNNKSK